MYNILFIYYDISWVGNSLKFFIQDIWNRNESETDRLETKAKELSEDIENTYTESKGKKFCSHIRKLKYYYVP